MANASLVSKAQELSKRLKELLDLLPKDDPLQLRADKKPAVSFLFEMHVLHRLLLELKGQGWNLQAVERSGAHRFARSPAKKSNYTYVVISRENEKYQVVHGTQIADMYQTPRAPDLSLQVGEATDAPSYQDIVAVWDAKLRGTTAKPSDKRISDKEFAGFLAVLKWLQVPRPGAGDEVLETFPPPFSVRALITNGLGPTEKVELMLDEGVSISTHFGSASSACSPQRQEHTKMA